MSTSGRTVARLLHVAEKTPAEVRHVMSRGELTLTAAEKVASLDGDERHQVTAEIRAGGEPAMVRKHISKPSGKHKKPKDAVDAFLRELERGVHDLEGRFEKVNILLDADESRTLDRAEAIIRAIGERSVG